jgi:hypothetical protein
MLEGSGSVPHTIGPGWPNTVFNRQRNHFIPNKKKVIFFYSTVCCLLRKDDDELAGMLNSTTDRDAVLD